MAHPRKLIRHAVVELLKGATDAGDRVIATRVEPQEARDLPALSVYTLSDPVDEDSANTAPVELKHDLQLEVAAWVAHSDTYSVDDAMDDIAEQIENAMDLDVYFGGTAGDSVLTGTVMQVVEDQGNDPIIGIVTLTYAVTYRKDRATRGALDDFRTVDAKYTQPPGGVSDTRIVEDTFTVQET